MTFELAVRIPGWARNEAISSDLFTFETKDSSSFTITVNGKPAIYQMVNGYAVIKSAWKKGDMVSLNLPMPIRRVIANEKVTADHEKVSLQRGPIVYCAEWPDNKDGHVLNLILGKNTDLSATYLPAKLSGTEIITGKASSIKRTSDNKTELTDASFTAIPYYAWANRGSGEMAVWFATQPSSARPLPAPTIASKSKVTASYLTKALIAVNDQMEPQNSNDQSVFYYHWWPMKDTIQWIQYSFSQPEKVSKASVYWFDDGPWGGCRIPESWEILYMASDGSWKPVTTQNPYGLAKDKRNEVSFDVVQTSALRLQVKLPKDNASGIYEWIVE
jgi:hypothetical protein